MLGIGGQHRVWAIAWRKSLVNRQVPVPQMFMANGRAHLHAQMGSPEGSPKIIAPESALFIIW